MKQTSPKTDSEGYLLNLDDWSPTFAEMVASEANLQLSDSHRQIINALRNFYHQFGISPSMRVFVKYLSQEIGPNAGSSTYLMQHFGGSPLKLLCKIAGLPKPTNCL